MADRSRHNHPVKKNEHRNTTSTALDNLKDAAGKVKKVFDRGGQGATPVVTITPRLPISPKLNYPSYSTNPPVNPSTVNRGFTLPKRKNDLTRNFDYSYNSRRNTSYYQEHRNTENTLVQQKKRKEREEWRKKNTLAGQIETEIDHVMSTGKTTPAYAIYNSIVQDAMENYIYNVDQEAMKEWLEDSYVTVERLNLETGKMEKVEVLKKNCPPPPVGTDKDGNTIDIKKAWDYITAYDWAINDKLIEQHEAQINHTETKYAGQSENGADADSMLDVFRDAVSNEASGTEALKSYVRDYFWNPLCNGDWGALGINTLKNLEETMDFFGIGARSIHASRDVIGGEDRSAMFEGQNVWWYGDSEESKSKQKQLVALGADKLLTGSAHSEKSYQTGGERHKVDYQSKEDIIRAIKGAGLWEDYKDMLDAYKSHRSSFITENKVLENIKSAYTDKESNYHADTGNMVKDIGLELVLDPTLVIGGAAKTVGSTLAKATPEVLVKAAAKATFAPRLLGEAEQTAANAAIKQFTKQASTLLNKKDLLTKGSDQLKDEISSLGSKLREASYLPGGPSVEWGSFEDALYKSIKDYRNSLNYKVVKSMHTIDDIADKADSILLKTVFAAPYIPAKAASLGYHGVRNEIARMIQRNDGLMEEALKRKQVLKEQDVETKSITELISTAQDLLKESDDPAILDDINKFAFTTRDISAAIDSPLSEFRAGKITANEYKTRVNAGLERVTGISGMTYHDLKNYVDTLYSSLDNTPEGIVEHLYQSVVKKVNQIDTVEKDLFDMETKRLMSELNKAKTIEDLESLSKSYFIRSAEHKLPDEYVQIIKAKVDEISSDTPFEKSDAIIRNFERNKNYSTDLNPRDAEVPLPDSVKDNAKLPVDIPLDMHPLVKDIKSYLIKHDAKELNLSTSSLRYLLTSIKNIEDIPPLRLQEELNKAINQLLIRQASKKDVDPYILDLLKQASSRLNSDLHVIVGQDSILQQVKLNKFTVYDEYINNRNYQKIIAQLKDTHNPLGSILQNVRLEKLSMKDYADNPFYHSLFRINDMFDANGLYGTFRDSLDSIDTITDRQKYMVVNVLFGILKGSPKNYLNNSMRNPEKFMEKVEDGLFAEYGEARSTLYGARTQMRSLDPDLFKNYASELKDDSIRDRVVKIASADQADPINNTRVQMLYTILRDPSSIDDYNELAKEKDVIFSDISTTGFNRDRDSITGMAFKKWVPIEGDITLDKILTFIEDTSTETVFKRSLSDDEFNKITDSTLRGIYRKHPSLSNAPRRTQLDAYKKTFGNPVDKLNTFDNEVDLLKAVNEYITEASIIRVQKGRFLKHMEKEDYAVPCLVFHNTHGFDMSFYSSRIQKTSVGIPQGSIKHFLDIQDASHNTISRLRALEHDVIFTAEEREQIERCVIEFSREMAKYEDGFRLLEPHTLLFELNKLRKISREAKRNRNALDEIKLQENKVFEQELTETPKELSTVSVDEFPKDSLATKLGIRNADAINDSIDAFLSNNQATKIYAKLNDICRDVGHTQNRYLKWVVDSSEVLDNEKAASEFWNIIRDSHGAVPDRAWAYLCYKDIFNGDLVNNYFHAEGNIPVKDLYRMQELATAVDHSLAYDLRDTANEIIEPYAEYWESSLYYLKQYAASLPQFSEFTYLKYLKVPSSTMEAYLMVQKIYDEVLNYSKHYEIIAQNSSFKGLPIDELKDFFVSDILRGKNHGYIFKGHTTDEAHYIDDFSTEQEQLFNKYRNTKIKLKANAKALDTHRRIGLMNSSEYADKLVIEQQEAYKEVETIIDTLMPYMEDANFWEAYSYFKDASYRDRMKKISTYRMNRLLESEESLISELIFTNGFRKIIPRFGDELHSAQVNKLLDNINKWNSPYVSLMLDGDHFILTLNPKYRPIINKDSVTGDLTASFAGIDRTFKYLPEEDIAYADIKELMKDYKKVYIGKMEKAAKDGDKMLSFEDVIEQLQLVYSSYQKIQARIDTMTGGASRGTMGVLSSYSKEEATIKSLSKDVQNNSLGIDYTGDKVVWNYASFDKSILGDFDNSWKLGSNADDFDYLLNTVHVLDEIAGRGASERTVLDTIFGDKSSCLISDLLKDNKYTAQEVLDFMDSNEEFVACKLVPSNLSVSGYEIKELRLKDDLDVINAASAGAVYLPYDAYLDYCSLINHSEISSKALNIWKQFLVFLKLGYLFNPGTWIRNYLDATMRVVGDTGSLATTLSYEFLAIQRLTRYQKIIRQAGMDVTELEWRKFGYDRYMTYKEFKYLQGLKSNDAVFSGDAQQARDIFRSWMKYGRKNKALNIDDYSTLGSDIQRFEQAYDSEKVSKLLTDLVKSNEDVSNNLSILGEERFFEIFNARQLNETVIYADGEEWLYNEIAKEIINLTIQRTKNKGMVFRHWFNNISGGMLTPMSQAEQIVRYAQVLALQDSGHTNASIYKHVIDTHFNYASKSLKTKCLEAVFPFATFQFNNLAYWVKQLDENPRMIRYIEDTIGKSSLQDLDDVYEQNENGESQVNNSLAYRILHGGLPIGNGGMYFKLNPSYTDAFNWVYGGPAGMLQNIAPPIRTGIKFSLTQLGLDSYPLFNGISYPEDGKGWVEELYKELPLVTTAFKYVNHFTNKDKPWEIPDVPLHQVLVHYMPDLFGVVKDYKRFDVDSFEDFQSKLKEQGEWYDANKDKIVSSAEENSSGLNNPDLDFEERKLLMYLLHGKLWDNNKEKFVPAYLYEEGGLNRDWDFSKEGEWEEFIKLKKKYQGVEYDFNRKKFTKNPTKGGLNSKDLEWDEVCDLYEQKGLYWDANRQQFVKENMLISGGLNKSDLSFPELSAYIYGIQGKIWDRSRGEFVKVTDPIVSVSSFFTDGNEDKFEELGFSTASITPSDFTYMEDGILKSFDGTYVLSDNEESNQKIFNILFSNYAPISQGYHSGRVNGYSYKKQPITPKKNYSTSYRGPKVKSARIKPSYDPGVGLKILNSGAKSYEAYYNKEYKYSYSYRYPNRNTVRRYDYHRYSNSVGKNKFSYYPS